MKKVLLCIMDGVGIRKNSLGNAYKNANTPLLDKLMKEYPNITLEASGEYVGLPKGQMGNSEVGHSSIGSGRIIYQSLERINKDIEDGSFYKKEELLNAISHVKENNSKLHLLGLLSDGGIHSTINHLFSILELCKKEKLNNVYIHVITDGRDTAPTSGIRYIKELENKIKELGVGIIGSISGRYYTMDRDNNFDRLKKSYDMLINGISTDKTIEEVWKESQYNGITDEFINPVLLNQDGIINDNDSVIIYNYRPDRLREIGTALTNDKVDYFDRTIRNNLYLVTMMPVSEDVKCTNVYPYEEITNVLGEVVSNNNLSQLRIAETEKYAHVTYFFDGGKELELNKCKRVLIPSPKVATYDMMPEMSAYKITDELIKELDNHPDLIVLNYANGDMVGHTGIYEKGIMAMETVDKCISKILDNIDLSEYTVIITADHGNCEEMLNDDGSINTQHTTNRVPFIVLDKNIKFKKMVGSLSSIAPTILNIMGLNIPKEINGESLIK